MTFLSIVVPVYNKEKYIDNCIQSIMSQSFIDFELILVNDGSTDGSGLICEYYKNLDSRVLVLHQNNQGVSAARNSGIAAATGKYIGFIDSDDAIEVDMYETMINNALKYDADISVCSMKVIFPDKIITPVSEDITIRILNKDEALSAALKGELERSANNKIYKLELIQGIWFKGSIYEDVYYTFLAFSKANSTVFENVCKYNYIIRDNSVSMSKFNIKYMEMILVTKKILNLVEANFARHLDEAKVLDIVANISILNLIINSDKNRFSREYIIVSSNLKEHSNFMQNSYSISVKHKLAYNLFAVSPTLYKLFLKLYCVFFSSEISNRT